MPDIDVDFCYNRRDEVIKYVSRKYGADHVAQIVAFGTMKAKGVIRDVARALDISLKDADRIAKLIPDDLKMTLTKALAEEPDLQPLIDSNPHFKKMYDVGRRLEGLTRHSSIHAAGIVISQKPMVEYLPLHKGKNGEVVTQFDMKKVELVGLIKFDFLGLKTLTVIDDALKLIRKNNKPAPILEKLPLDDPQTFELLCRGETDGVFQLESDGMRRVLRGLKPSCFEDIIALLALYRPGPLESGMVDDFIGRKHGLRKVEYEYPELAPVVHPILEDTYGVILYQEQVMKIASDLAKYSLGEGDNLRRAMGKKDKAKMAKEKDKFIEQGITRGYDKGKVAELFDLIEYFAGYGFNKSHSAAYAMVAYETGYLKANFRTEFMAGLLSTKSQRTDDVVKYIANCREIGIQVLGPDINESELDFTITGQDQIRFGLAAIKGLGEAALEAILAARKAEGPFKDLFHALKSTDLQKANRKVWECLIKAGAFDSLEANRAALLEGLPSALENASRGGNADLGLVSLFDEAEMASLADNWSLPEGVEPWSRKERLKAERETLGLYVSGHPLEEYVDALKVHTVGSITTLREQVAAGRVKDRDEVALGLMVSNVAFKTNQKGEPWAILALEDLTDKIEGLLMASRFDPQTKQRSRPFELNRHLAQPDGLLRVTGELRVESANGNGAGEGEEDEDQTVLKLFVTSLEPLEDFQGRGFTGALVRLPVGEMPPQLLPLLKAYAGPLPVTFEYRSKEGITARVKPGPEWRLRFDPDLADKLAKDAGCGLSWNY